MNRATAHRLLGTLESRGYLQRNPDTLKYRLGVRVFDLGARPIQQRSRQHDAGAKEADHRRKSRGL
jgi:DNA-binding IclR family transcriptional regulator